MRSLFNIRVKRAYVGETESPIHIHIANLSRTFTNSILSFRVGTRMARHRNEKHAHSVSVVIVETLVKIFTSPGKLAASRVHSRTIKVGTLVKTTSENKGCPSETVLTTWGALRATCE